MRNQITLRSVTVVQVAAIGVAALVVVLPAVKDNTCFGTLLFIFLVRLVMTLGRLITRDTD